MNDFVAEPLLTRGEVAALFRVDPRTVTRWTKAGKLSVLRTLGGHLRYPESEVRALLRTGKVTPTGIAAPPASVSFGPQVVDGASTVVSVSADPPAVTS